MEHIAIGSSGLTTSRIGLGTWAIGGWMWGGADERQAIATIRTAVERGVTLIDTAPVYGFGTSEEIVGKALAGGLRDRVQIATKAGLAWREGEVYRDSRPARLTWEFEDSLRRLRVDGDDLRKVDPKFQRDRFPQYLAAVDELAALARQRFGKSILALAVQWVLDQGPTIALWGARRPDQLDPIDESDGWRIDAAARREIDAILARCTESPVSPAFMAPPLKRPEFAGGVAVTA